MACTTILVGKKASYDGSTIIARNDDSGSGHYMPKKFVVVEPEEQPKTYRSVLAHLEIPLPEEAMRYTSMPNAVDGEGIWAASGVNAAHVAMTATETITSNPRVLGADPLVEYQTAENGNEEIPGGIGEEDIVCLVLPYIRSARAGVERLGNLLETYGTYEMNGIAFQDQDEIWWMETIGGHHWIAKNAFDQFIEKNHLDLTIRRSTERKAEDADLPFGRFINPREIFGSHDDSDHVYNTPRAWFMERYLNPKTYCWDGENADYTPVSDDIPWSLIPENKVTMEDVKYVLSSHYQGTPYDPYLPYGDKKMAGAYRSIGINRTDFMSAIQMRPYGAEDSRGIEWVAFASNAFNVMVPFYANVDTTPEYLANTTADVSTDNFYWSSRMIAAMADASYSKSLFHIERYQETVLAKGHEVINRYDEQIEKEPDAGKRSALREQANQEMADILRKETGKTLSKVLYELSNQMKNSYARSDA